PVLAVLGRLDHVAAERQRTTQRIAQGTDVVDDQDAHGGIIGSTPKTRRRALLRCSNGSTIALRPMESIDTEALERTFRRLKAHVGGRIVHTGQLFFSDAVTASVYRHGVYRGRGQADTSNGADMIYSEAGGSRAKVALTRRSAGGYSGRVTVGVRT